jgi:hypothetical protein
MQMKSNGQVQRRAAEWSAISARYRQSGLGSRQFCEQAGVTRRTGEKGSGRSRRSETSQGRVGEVTSPLGTGGPWAGAGAFPTGVRLRVRGEGEVGHARGAPHSGGQPPGSLTEVDRRVRGLREERVGGSPARGESLCGCDSAGA